KPSSLPPRRSKQRYATTTEREGLCARLVLRTCGFIAASAASTSGMAALAVKRALSKWSKNYQPNKTQGGKMKIETMEPKTGASEVSASKVVSEAEWLVARKDLLTREKELTRLRDEVSRHRRELPWVKV